MMFIDTKLVNLMKIKQKKKKDFSLFKSMDEINPNIHERKYLEKEKERDYKTKQYEISKKHLSKDAKEKRNNFRK